MSPDSSGYSKDAHTIHDDSIFVQMQLILAKAMEAFCVCITEWISQPFIIAWMVPGLKIKTPSISVNRKLGLASI